MPPAVEAWCLNHWTAREFPEDPEYYKEEILGIMRRRRREWGGGPLTIPSKLLQQLLLSHSQYGRWLFKEGRYETGLASVRPQRPP